MLDEFQTVASGINELKGTFHRLMTVGKDLVFIFTGSAGLGRDSWIPSDN